MKMTNKFIISLCVNILLVISLIYVSLVNDTEKIPSVDKYQHTIDSLQTLITENNQLGLQLLYWPNTKNDTFIAAIWFTVSQILAFVCYMNLNDLINVNIKKTGKILQRQGSILYK